MDDGVLVDVTPRPAPEQQIKVSVVEEGVVVDMAVVAVNNGHAIGKLVMGVRPFAHRASIVRGEHIEDFEILTQKAKTRSAHRVHGVDVVDLEVSSMRLDVSWTFGFLPAERKDIALILPSIKHDLRDRVIGTSGKEYSLVAQRRMGGQSGFAIHARQSGVATHLELVLD